MTDTLSCWRCGHSLAGLSLPLSRMDECPSCTVALHVCKMCRHYDRHAIDQCRQEESNYVKEKERPNFCDYFAPDPAAFQPDSATGEAKRELDALFGEGEGDGDAPTGNPLDDLFR